MDQIMTEARFLSRCTHFFTRCRMAGAKAGLSAMVSFQCLLLTSQLSYWEKSSAGPCASMSASSITKKPYSSQS